MTRATTLLADLVVLFVTWKKLYQALRAASEAHLRGPLVWCLLRDGERLVHLDISFKADL